jgi:hypothetical protein
MNPLSSIQSVAAMAFSFSGDEQLRQERTRNFLYQAGTILAILLLLISF